MIKKYKDAIDGINKEHENDCDEEGSPQHAGHNSPDASPDADSYYSDAPYDSSDGGGCDDDDAGGGYDDDDGRY